MNNKGFAITGILYTIMILFLLILVSVLSALSSRNNLLEKSIEKIQNEFVGTSSETAIVEEAKTTNIAPVTGKYKFSIAETPGVEISDDIACYSFLKKGTSLIAWELDYTTISCNDGTYNQNNYVLTDIYQFE